MQFGMPTLIEIRQLEDTMKLCRELGLDFVELNMNLPDYQADRLEDTEKLLELKERYQIGFTIHLDENLNVCDFNREVAEAYLSTVKRTIAAAKEFGAPILNMHMNHGVYFTLPEQKVELFAVYQEEYQEAWKRFRHMCEEEIGDADICICIENTDGYRDYEKQAIRYLLESKVFGLTWDIGHSHGVQDRDEPFLMEQEERLLHFHIHDALGTKNHRALGTGEIDLAQRLQIAKRHDCRLVLETKTVRALRESVDWLKEKQSAFLTKSQKGSKGYE
ncbi:MAG: sugar phosphate isomerase/epimerase [Lachnospiraceae bacterium]|nr:sugar phosphate isomerase/epimerase [Lachnospiraceae bacterium]